MFGKSNDANSLSIRVQTTINHISIFTFLCFFRQYQRQRRCFFQSASWKRHYATHWREQRGWDLVIFDWFVLSMRMQVILDSSFARPGSAPLWGGKKGEFRDWTILWLERQSHNLVPRVLSLLWESITLSRNIVSLQVFVDVSRFSPWSSVCHFCLGLNNIYLVFLILIESLLTPRGRGTPF